MGITARFVSSVTRLTSSSEGQLFAFAPEQIDVVEGLRVAVAIGVILAAQMLSGAPELAYGAVAIFWTALCDPKGPGTRRLRVMATFCLVGAVVIAIASCAANWGSFASGAALVVLVFLCGLTRTYQPAYGPMPSQIGLIASIAAVIGISAPGTFNDALGLGACFLLGAAWYILLAMVIWRDRPSTGWNLVVVAILTRLEEAFHLLLELDDAAAKDDRGWERFDSIHHRAIRFSLERGRHAATRLGEGQDRHCEMFDAAGRIFSCVVALAHDRRQSSAPFDRSSERPLLEKLETLLQLGLREAGNARPDPDAVMAEVKVLLAMVGDRDDFVSRAVTLATEAIRAIAGRWNEPVDPQVVAVSGAVSFGHGIPIAVWRNSLRTTIAVLVSYCTGLLFDLSLSYWGVIATLVVMQPMAGNTWLRVLERATGTMIGGLIAAALLSWASEHWQLAVVIVPLSAVVIALRLVNYGLFVIFLTPLFMLLTDYANPVDDLVWERVLNEVRGACVAIAVGLVLWPEKEQDGLASALSAAITANLAYVVAVLRSDGRSAGLDALQRDAGITSSRMEAVYNRLWFQGQRQAPAMKALHQTTMALRALCGAATALSLRRKAGTRNADWALADRYEALASDLAGQVEAPAAIEIPERMDASQADIERSLLSLVVAVREYSRHTMPMK